MEQLRGVNVGGWLLMEGYFLQGRSIAEHQMKEQLQKACGAAAVKEFSKAFRDTYIQEQDFKNIKAMGATVIRLPFNHRLIETAPYHYSEEGFGYLDRALKWAE